MKVEFWTTLVSRLLLNVTLRAGRLAAFASRNHVWLQMAAGTGALALGFWGWTLEKPPVGPKEILDNVFRTLQLVTLQFPNVPGSSPNWQLQIARLLVPLGAILATLQVLVASITRPARLALLPYTSGHIVVTGSAHMTEAALKKVASRGEQVVVTGSDMRDRDTLEGCGITIFDAGPLQLGSMRSLHISRAAAFFVLGQDAMANLNIAMQALPAVDERPPALQPLILAVRVDDEDLAREMDHALDSLSRRHGVRYYGLSPTRESIRIELSWAAPALFKTDRSRTHVLVVGLQPNWRAIAMQIITALQDDPDQPPILTFALREQELETLERWRARTPELDLIVEIAVLRCQGDTALPSEEAARSWRAQHPSPQLAVVLGDDIEALTTALTLRRPGNLLGTEKTPILVHQIKGDRLLASLGSAQVEHRDLTRLIPIGPSLRVETVERVLDRKGEEVAMALHARYLSSAGTLGSSSAEVVRAWEDLAENVRDSNRAAVEHAPIMLAAVGRSLAPASAAPVAANLTQDELEVVARIEHRRWITDRLSHGWRYGPTRNDPEMLHPDLVPYDALPRLAKQKDRNSITVLLSALQEEGQVVVRKSIRAI